MTEIQDINTKGKANFSFEKSVSHLLHRLLQVSNNNYSKEVGRYTTTQRQFAILHALAQTPDLSQSDLVNLTGIDRSTMGQICEKLEKKGLLLKNSTPLDNRKNSLVLSEAGNEEYNKLLPIITNNDSELLVPLAKIERKAFIQTLNKLLDDREIIISIKKKKKEKKASKKLKVKKAKESIIVPVLETKPSDQ